MRTTTSLLLGLPLGLIPAIALAQTSAPAAPADPAGHAAAAAVVAATDETMADEEEGPDIVVSGSKPRGSVVGDIQPEITLSPADVRSYGVNSVADLLNELTPQTTSGRGRGGGMPVILINGRRSASFLEIRDLPTEAIQRVEILPEEVSLKYGYGADQRVVNFVLRQRFRALVGQATGSLATEGGGESVSPEANLVRINRDRRVSFNLRYQNSVKLRESERDLTSIPSGTPFDTVGNIAPVRGATQIDPALSALAGQTVTVAGVPGAAASGAPTLADFAGTANRSNTTDISRFRTLRSGTEQISGSAVYSQPFLSRSTATVSANLAYNTGDSLRGLPGATLTLPTDNPFSPFTNPVTLYRYVGSEPLHQRTEGITGHLGLGVNGDRGQWRWTVNANYDYAENRTRTGTGLDFSTAQARLDGLDATFNPFADLSSVTGGLLTDRARSVSNNGELQLVVGGPLFRLPAGPVSANIRTGFEYTGFDSSSLRSSIAQGTSLTRKNTSGQINLDVPIANAGSDVLPFLGRLSANFNARVQEVSDFGTLTTLGGGLYWTPHKKLMLIGSYTDEEGAPTIQQLGNPLVQTPNIRVFDYVRGTTADVIQIEGGNRALQADNRHVLKLGATIKPLNKGDLTAIINFTRSRIRNSINTLPEATADIQNAFPERFIRNAAGQLISVDTRSVNFERESLDQIRMGFNFSVPLKSTVQRKFETWLAERRAGKNPPFPIPMPQLTERERQRFQRMMGNSGAAPQGSAAAAPGAAPTPPGAMASNTAPTANGADTPPPQDAAPPPPPDDGVPPPGGPAGGFGGPGAGGPGGGGFRGAGGGPRGGFGGGPGGQGNGRLQFALYDTWTLKNEILVRQGVPVIDLLNGGSVGAGGGQSRHQVELQAGYANNGIGVRLSGNWQSATTVRAGSASTTGDLRFEPFTTANLRVFADLSQIPSLIGKRWARGTRITLSVNNITNERQTVRDATGTIPLRYQGAYLDPIGRTVSLSIRKLLF